MQLYVILLPNGSEIQDKYCAYNNLNCSVLYRHEDTIGYLCDSFLAGKLRLSDIYMTMDRLQARRSQ